MKTRTELEVLAYDFIPAMLEKHKKKEKYLKQKMKTQKGLPWYHWYTGRLEKVQKSIARREKQLKKIKLQLTLMKSNEKGKKQKQEQR